MEICWTIFRFCYMDTGRDSPRILRDLSAQRTLRDSYDAGGCKTDGVADTHLQGGIRQLVHGTTWAAKESVDVTALEANASAAKQMLCKYPRASDKILEVVENSSGTHVGYVNPFLGHAAWMAATVQLLQGELTEEGPQTTLHKPQFEILKSVHKQFVMYWSMSAVPSQNLDLLTVKLGHLKNTTKAFPTEEYPGSVSCSTTPRSPQVLQNRTNERTVEYRQDHNTSFQDQCDRADNSKETLPFPYSEGSANIGRRQHWPFEHDDEADSFRGTLENDTVTNSQPDKQFLSFTSRRSAEVFSATPVGLDAAMLPDLRCYNDMDFTRSSVPIGLGREEMLWNDRFAFGHNSWADLALQ